MTASSTFHHQPAKKNFESLDHSAICDKHSANCEAEHILSLPEALQEKHDNIDNVDRAVHYKSLIDREARTNGHTRSQKKKTSSVC